MIADSMIARGTIELMMMEKLEDIRVTLEHRAIADIPMTKTTKEIAKIKMTEAIADMISKIGATTKDRDIAKIVSSKMMAQIIADIGDIAMTTTSRDIATPMIATMNMTIAMMGATRKAFKMGAIIITGSISNR
jgi:hypothetical protein